MIGGIIMTHGDDSGLVLPPAVAPIQIVVIPIASHKAGVSEAAAALSDRLSARFRVKLDDSDNSAGWKFSEYEMKGVPLRLEIGPRDLEANQCVLVSRLDRSKKVVSLDDIEAEVEKALEAVRAGLYEKALASRKAHSLCKTPMK